MTNILALGFLIGLQHALEADHLSAVAALACRLNSSAGLVRQGVFWGIGHSLALLAFAGIVFVCGRAIPGYAADWLEAGVAVMLVGLGADVLVRLRRDEPAAHGDRHDEGRRRLQTPGRPGRLPHAAERDPARLPWRTLLVGIAHGLAGSAALLVLLVGATQSLALGIAYIGLFGAGSIVGMAALSAVIAVPLRYSAPRLLRLRRLVHGLAGSMTIVVGLSLMAGLGRA